MKDRFIEKDINRYCEIHTSPGGAFLQEIERRTHLRTLTPQMLPGMIQGRFLSMISKMIQPQSILEIGSFTGYSALCLAEGLGNNGTLITIENDPEMIAFVKESLAFSNFSDRIKLIQGNALEIIPGLEQRFDLVFIDAAKTEYLEYYHRVFPLLNVNGFIIADNVLWSYKVLDKNPDPVTESILAFNEFIRNDERVENALLPLRDGIQIIQKIKD